MDDAAESNLKGVSEKLRFDYSELELFFFSLRQVLLEDELIMEPEAMRPFECDALTTYRQRPMAVAIPREGAQIREILWLCHNYEVPVVARGAGTGLSGGAMPHKQGLLLVLSRLDKIVELDPLARLARVQPGVRNIVISEAAAPYDLFYSPDPSSQLASSIGGNVAENSGGIHCLKYGLTTHNIQELRCVNIEGEEFTVSSEDACYDLMGLITGSEGLLAVVTEVVVRLRPIPKSTRLLCIAFDDVQRACEAVYRIIEYGITPSALEFIDKITIEALNKYLSMDYPEGAEAVLLCELDGNKTRVGKELEVITELADNCRATSIQLAQDEEQRQKLWRGRKNALNALGNIAPEIYVIDGSLPRRKLGEVLRQIERLSKEFKIPVGNVFHAGDGNLHPCILFDPNSNPAIVSKVEELGGLILEACLDAGGTITGEHGVGVEKLRQMCVQFSSDELEQFHRLRQAFDPNLLLNPEKAIPTLTRCAEYGRARIRPKSRSNSAISRF